jgi:ABC-type amino acid transport substrate-binding protein
MNARTARPAALALAAAFHTLPLHASEPAARPPALRMAHTEAMSYPLLTVSGPNKLSGGFLKELGDLIAAELGTQAQHQLVSRRRMQATVMGGDADIACYFSPLWLPGTGENWTVAVVPQVERVVSLATAPLAFESHQDLHGRRVAVLLGYQYPQLQPAFEAGLVTRLDESQVDLLFRRLRLDMADALITSEVEIAGYFKRYPQERERFHISSRSFSVTDTQCLVSPASPWRLAAINEALHRLIKSGAVAKLAQRYGMSSGR